MNEWINYVFAETLYQESSVEYAVMSNEERQIEVYFLQFFFFPPNFIIFFLQTNNS